MSGTATSGSDIGKAASAFSDSSEEIKGQAKAVSEAKATPEKAGRKFQEAGQAYKQALEKLGKNIESFASHGTKLSEDFTASAKEYTSSDETGANEVGKVQV
ncbi:Excreted virulence factor EspC, type VII ESX diderm [Saccharopolyspora kobensis]|uniref:Excreted virulence factor EspC, type VII ESX diderm n=1 Tax=Saccharopolyspora kobensis TaxID=146035 RepID=A0A1H6EC91_9PSEU|nr:type VII secretion target [Saccharopolyspora kobensis]SEG95372.1 Excreted virulence factor EspC, type VII ESX diderm [Saccharopolyspora kobensis]SFD57006.1 Excreted virulence factor EspC, type VII ESX diderm [Saccharopolyspora kobensis]